MVELLVSLALAKEPEHMVADEVELIWVDISGSCIVLQEPEKKCPLVLIIASTSADRFTQAGATVELGVYAGVAPLTQRYSIPKFKGAPRVKSFSDHVMRLQSLTRLTTNASAITQPYESTP